MEMKLVTFDKLLVFLPFIHLFFIFLLSNVFQLIHKKFVIIDIIWIRVFKV